jgi:hypothetical protein
VDNPPEPEQTALPIAVEGEAAAAGLTHKELAELLNKPESTMRNWGQVGYTKNGDFRYDKTRRRWFPVGDRQ